MKTFLLTAVALFAGLALGFYLASGSVEPVHAQGPETYALNPGWGSVKGTMGNRMLVLEDAAGVIRIIDLAKFNVSTKRLEVERLIERK